MLFLALLYYLLAAQSDPLLAAVGVLPLSEAGRQRTAVALNRALGGASMPGVGWMPQVQVSSVSTGRHVRGPFTRAALLSTGNTWLHRPKCLRPPSCTRCAHLCRQADCLPRLLLLDHLPSHGPAPHLHGAPLLLQLK